MEARKQIGRVCRLVARVLGYLYRSLPHAVSIFPCTLLFRDVGLPDVPSRGLATGFLIIAPKLRFRSVSQLVEGVSLLHPFSDISIAWCKAPSLQVIILAGSPRGGLELLGDIQGTPNETQRRQNNSTGHRISVDRQCPIVEMLTKFSCCRMHCPAQCLYLFSSVITAVNHPHIFHVFCSHCLSGSLQRTGGYLLSD
jgi:hypothetical protein